MEFQPNISFKSLDQFFEYLPDEERKMVETLRSIILDTLPQCKEKLSYNVPFYSLKRRICFIWPGSIPWGGTKAGVQLGFNYGPQLTHDNYLEKGTRKTVFIKTFLSITEIDRHIVEGLLLESELIDKES